MDGTPDIIVVGSHAPGLLVNVKRTPTAGETVIGWDFRTPQDGGKGSNQAIAAARLGARVGFVGCVGQDRIGDEGEGWLREAGVDTTWLRRSQTTPSGVGFIILDEFGVPAMVTSLGANADLSAADIDGALDAFAQARVLLTQFEIDPDLALYAARAARRRAMTTIVNPAPAPDGGLAGLDAADILVPNESEARTLLGLGADDHHSPGMLAKRLREHTGAAYVIVTLGERGIAGADAVEEWEIPALAVQVVDTSGAGDVFCAALAVGVIRGWNLRRSAEWANRAASLSVTRPGTISAFPTATEVAEFMVRPATKVTLGV